MEEPKDSPEQNLSAEDRRRTALAIAEALRLKEPQRLGHFVVTEAYYSD